MHQSFQAVLHVLQKQHAQVALNFTISWRKDNAIVVLLWIAVSNVRGETNVLGASQTWHQKMDFVSTVSSGYQIAKLVKTLSINAKNVQGDTMPKKMDLA